MLRRFFKRKPRLDAPNAGDRVAAVAALGGDQQATFARLLREDPDHAVRLAALERLNDLEALATALGEDDIAHAAALRLLALVDERTPPAIRDHPVLCRAAVANSANGEQAVQAAGKIDDAAELAAALLENSNADVRLAVASASWRPHILTELEKAVRGRDKAVNRLARERLALYRGATAQREAQDVAVQKTLAAASALAHEDAHYDARRNALERDWEQHLRAVEATDDELARFGVVQRDLNALRGRFPAPRTPRKPAVAPVAVDFAPLLEAAESLRQQLAEEIAGETTRDALSRFRREADDLTAQWSANADIKPPTAASSAAFRDALAQVASTADALERARHLAGKCRDLLQHPVANGQDADSLAKSRRRIHRRREAVENLIARYAWPDDLAKPADLLALEQRLRDLAAAAEHCDERQTALAQEIEEGVATLRELVEAGSLAEAVVLERQLREQERQLPREAVPSAGELAELGAQIRRLRGWRTYAQVPRREALCEQLETLAKEPLDVYEQAEAVKSLRQQWNDLGALDSRAERELRTRFEDAAERAFEHCRVHFKEQAAAREFNLQQRQAIVAALSDFVDDNDWEHADWRGVERVLRQARAEWRQYHPVERKAGRELTDRFEAIAADLHERLKGEWTRNIEAKEGIVDEARQIGESADTATDKADALKALQRRWKAVGPTPRRADQRLWKLFRAECDSVFEARNTVRDRHDRRQRAIDDIRALLTELAKRVDIDPALDRNTVADYERRLHEFEDLPKDLQQQVDAMLEHADRAAIERQAANAARD